MLLHGEKGECAKKGPIQMEVKPALALPEGLELVGLQSSDGVLTVTVISTQFSPRCPLCGVVARRIHSSYSRQVADLPCGGQPVRLLLQVRKYFCDESTCARKIFAERLTPFVEPWARVTQRLFQVVQVLGLATGGRLGVRVTDRLGIATTRQTIDVLADRKAETTAAWMAAHPEITKVASRPWNRLCLCCDDWRTPGRGVAQTVFTC